MRISDWSSDVCSSDLCSRLLSRPRLWRTCSMASWVAAGPAKKAAGSPGKARVRRKVTTRTPITLGIAEKIRLPIRPSIVALPPARYAMAALHLADAAEVELAVEPVGVAGDVFID